MQQEKIQSNVRSLAFDRVRTDAYEKAGALVGNARDQELVSVKKALDDLAIHSSATIVELGSGQGFATSLLCQYLAPNGVLYATDESPYMLEKMPELRQVRKHVGPVDSLSLADASVDFAFTLAAFHHMPHKYLILRELKRILKPGAFFLVFDVAHGTEAQKVFDFVVRPYCPNGHDADFLDREWAEVLGKRAGLTLLESEIVDMPWNFSSLEEAYTFAENLFCLEGERETLRQTLDLYARPFVSGDGQSYRMPWSLGKFVFQKK